MLLAAAAAPGAATAQQAPRAGSFEAAYALSLAGVNIGAARLRATVDGAGAYEIDLHARLTGLAGVLVSGKGGARATGRIAGERILPESLAVIAAAANDTRTLRMAFSGGAVSAVEINPPLENWDVPDRVAVTAAHRAGVTDPLSALLMPAPGRRPGEVCNRTIPVFDGATRFDVVLRYKGQAMVTQAGYSGPAITCSARYAPVSGHRPDRRMTKFMEQNTDMGVTLAPVADTGLYAPLRIYIRTTMGMSVMQATRVTINGVSVASGRDRPSR